MNKLYMSLLVFLFSGAILFSQGDTRLDELKNPGLSALGSNGVVEFAPMSDGVNPASSAALQRITLDLNYLAVFNTGNQAAWGGNALNFGLAIPGKAGVLSASGFFINSGYSELNTGFLAGGRVGFSKDVYENLYLGTGVQLGLGSGYSIAMDLGFIHKPARFFQLQNFSWGLALKQFGYSTITTAYPDLFTLALSGGFTALDSDAIDIRVLSSMEGSFDPNFRINLGSDIVFFDAFTLQLGSRFDTRDFSSIGVSSLIPSVGLTFTYKTNFSEEENFLGLAERGWNQSDINFQTAYIPLSAETFGTGIGLNIPLGVTDTTAPRIEFLDLAETTYISPNLDGNQDTLEFGIKLSDSRYIKGYTLKILDSEGNLVRSIQNKEERPTEIGFQSFFSQLFYVKTGIPVPETLRIDGNSDQGAVLPDGSYTFSLDAWDDNGNIATSEKYNLVVDNTAPQLELPESIDLVFSPNGDGNKDELIIEQSGSEEDLWTLRIEDTSGNTVFTSEYSSNAPQTFVWRGVDDQGTLVADGVYSYSISSTDRAGNITSTQVENIIINTIQTPIVLTVGDSHMSPNSDGIKDSMVLNADIPVKTGVQTWTMAIKNSRDETVRVFQGSDRVDERIIFDGRSDSNQLLPEGEYYGFLDVRYINGNNPTSTTPTFVIDITAPSVRLSSDINIFSPNGDGNKDVVSLFHETSDEQQWTAEINSLNGEKIRSYSWRGRADSQLVWDGTTDQGTLAADGSYTYVIRSTDRAGNSTASAPIQLTLNTEETPVFLSLGSAAFSPNGDGVQDTMSILPQLKVSGGIVSYSLEIKDSRNNIIRSFQGSSLPASFNWEGRNASGNLLPDGEYTAKITVSYSNGNIPEAVSRPFILDTALPEVEANAEYTVFSPNADGLKDRLVINQESSSEELWEAAILNQNGNAVRQFFWKGSVETLNWDGKDESGNPVPDGVYSYTISTEDAAGNTATATVRNIQIDTRPTQVFVTASSNGVSPNGDGVKDDIEFKTIVNLKDGIESWELRFIDARSGNPRTAMSGEGTPPELLNWDNISGDIPDGTYRAELVVNYFKGDQPKSRTGVFSLDRVAPVLKIATVPTPFSPDNDGVADELTISINVEDISEIEKWKLDIFDPRGNIFIEFSGQGSPTSRLIWDGLSRTGELVLAAEDYKYVMTVQDAVGNVSMEEGLIPVDVLVIREGDRLKIRVASINFAASSPAFRTDSAEFVEKNKSVLARIAQILNRYSQYQIQIEGHATSLLWYDAERAAREERDVLAPLSLARAQTVKDELIRLGVDGSRIIVKGLGGTTPVIPHSDVENRWKNRRVEFILIK
jgi:flagellar hook assembly protein FlgD/outer membrane protein OmpA-like peptidoglycan-associated protein